MTDQAVHVIRKTEPRADTESGIIADGVTLYIGMLAQYEGGYLNHWDETDQFAGLVIGGKDRARDGVLLGETSDTPPPEAIIAKGATLMHVAVANATQAYVGQLVWCADSNVSGLTITDTTNPPVGRLKRFRSATDCDVQLFTPEEWLAGDAGAGWAT
jgi:hypothetical protein